jgi:hypothetical protein
VAVLPRRRGRGEGDVASSDPAGCGATGITSIVLYSTHQAHGALSALWASIKPLLQDGKRLTLKVEEEKRTSEQNKRLWALLTDISRQVEWHGQYLEPAEWKDVFTAALKRQKVVPGMDGGFVVLGSSTSKMTKAEMSDLQTLMEAFGAERGVEWSKE